MLPALFEIPVRGSVLVSQDSSIQLLKLTSSFRNGLVMDPSNGPR